MAVKSYNAIVKLKDNRGLKYRNITTVRGFVVSMREQHFPYVQAIFFYDRHGYAGYWNEIKGLNLLR